MILAQLNCRDQLQIKEGEHSILALQFTACSELLQLLKEMKNKYGDDLKSWQAPQGLKHSEILLREFLAKMKGAWQLPYEHYELCHCRAVPTEVVDQAIVAGAHTPAAVSRWTSASTACGTCRPDVERILKYRLTG